ncbi:MAG: polysaccharide deacetylase family protein [Acidimicrobiales bacterium]|nr:polysaccharide deacetylase family protein [Acidimicrobiales bacterium]
MEVAVSEVTKRAAGLAALALDRVLPSRNSERVGVLMYHRTAPTTSVDANDQLNVPPGQFRAHLLGLQELGYNFIGIDQLINWLNGTTELPDNSVHVTFDDGYACTAQFAAPILQELDIPATVFVNTAFTGDSDAFPFDPNRSRYGDAGVDPVNYRPMSSNELHGLIADSTITIGAHSHSHSNFVEHPEDFDEDIMLNTKILREDYGLESIPFAFPYGVVRLGYAGGELSRRISVLNVTCAFSTEPELIDRSDDRYCLGRFSAYPFDTPRTLAAKLNGWLGWISGARQLLNRG